jgi:ABC-type iron transport system FetAB permease component
MLLAGGTPIDAVRLQLVLLGGVSIAALVAVLLARAFFMPAHHLRDPRTTAR